jgi:hypothetical protein
VHGLINEVLHTLHIQEIWRVEKSIPLKSQWPELIVAITNLRTCVNRPVE